eukprot:TRINITY_DN11908_c0_g2_i1.p1 TRINITY_DN11908_c0_g2~~TRINITY_DN11908_c0_g2_i1.p1  ORF type:complete len:252 (+),score=27.07 TRINITY_DN11908_c0_g2_i1:2012-2767(+)
MSQEGALPNLRSSLSDGLNNWSNPTQIHSDNVPVLSKRAKTQSESTSKLPVRYANRYPGTHMTAMRYEQEIYCYPLSVAEIPFKPPATFLHQHFDRSYTQFCISQRNHSRRKPKRIDIFINPLLENPFKDLQQSLRRAGKETRELFVFVGGTPRQLRLAVFNGLPSGKDGIMATLCVDDAIEKSGDGRAVMMCLALPNEHAHSSSTSVQPDSSAGLRSSLYNSAADSKNKPWHRVFRRPEQLLPVSIIMYE